MQIVSICDLARIASAAAKISRADAQGAETMLNNTKDIEAFEYLFNDEDLPVNAIREISKLPGLRPEIKAFFAKILPGFNEGNS
jgi:hypothetical protein